MLRYLLASLLLVLATTVPSLTPEAFPQYLATHSFMLVKFFSPQCGHCIAMAPQYELLHQQSEGKDYEVYEVDCSQYHELCAKNAVQAYPTIKLFAFGAPFQYDGERIATAISEWIGQFTTLTLPLLEPQDVKSKIGAESFILVSGQSEIHLKAFAIFERFGGVQVKYYGLQSTTSFIRYYKQGSTSFIEYNIDQNFPNSLIQWSFKASNPPVLDFSDQLMEYLQTQTQAPFIFLLVDQGDSLGIEAAEALNGWCLKKQELICVRATPKTEQYERIKLMANVESNRTTLSLIRRDLSIGYKYPYQTVSEDSLELFLSDALADKIQRSIDAQRDIKNRVKYTNVVKLNSQTLSTILAENDFVFIEFYIPTCQHCIDYAPEYQKVGAQFKEDSEPKVIVAAVDSSDDHEIAAKFDLWSYPNFKVSIKGDVLNYDGKREPQVMIQFINGISKAILLVSPNIKIIPRPFVAIRGISDSSPLHSLPALFSGAPLYHVTDKEQFSIEFHGQEGIKTYKGANKLVDIIQWLDHVSSPVLVTLGEPVPSKKLQRAMNIKRPLLVVFNKHERAAAAPALDFLTKYCEQHTKFVCGYVHSDEPDYSDLLEWTGDKDNETNRLFWINTESLSKYLYPGNPNQLNKQSLDAFVADAIEGSLSSYEGSEQGQNEEL